MKNPDKVLAICNDPYYQKEFFRLSDEALSLEGRLSSCGAISPLRSIAESLSNEQSSDAVRAKLYEAASIISKERIDELVSEELRRFASRPLYATTARTIDSEALTGIVLFDSDQLRVSLVSIGPIAHRIKKSRKNDASVSGITMQGTDSFIKFIKGGNATLNLWLAEPAKCINRQTEKSPMGIRYSLKADRRGCLSPAASRPYYLPLQLVTHREQR